MSSYPHTSSQQRPAEPRRGGIELSTLFAAGVAAVVAAYVVSKVWAPGTLWATAFTPVVVSLVKEALERPAQKVGAVATRAVAAPRARDLSGPPPPVVVDHDDELTERKLYATASRNLPRRWKLAVITGLVAFVAAVALYTLPELVAGTSVTSGSSHTTFFGGGSGKASSTTTDTTKTDTTTVTKTTTTPAQATPTTTTPPAKTAPTTTPTTTTPAPTTPTPAQTTPATPAPAAPTTTTP
jgi:hypothetical protein